MPTVSTANSYATISEITTFCSEQGLTAWASASTDDRETAALRGMAYIESKIYKGQKYANTQTRKWPREYATDEDNVEISTGTIPTAVKNAQCRAAYEEVVSPGVLQPNLTRDSFTSREKVDVIDISYEPGRNSTVFQAIDGYLVGYTLRTGRVIRV